jgi:hypothetical protein
MGFAGYISVCLQLYVGFHCLSLHVSVYMAIFKRVGYFYFHMPEGICFAGLLPFFLRGHTQHVSICVFPMLFSFVNFVVSLRVCLSACFFFKGKHAECDHVKKGTKKAEKQNLSGIRK